MALDRSRITFEQAEGLEPLPTQMKLRFVDGKLRAHLWSLVYESIMGQLDLSRRIGGGWKEILKRKHVRRDAKPADEFHIDARVTFSELKPLLFNGSYEQVLGFTEWLARQPETPVTLILQMAEALEEHQCAYRLVDNTIVPIASPEEATAIARAFADVIGNGLEGARSHLRRAAEHLSAGRHADAVREAMQAVESVARASTEANRFSDALRAFESRWKIHPALKTGFARIYDYTSDAQGLRHPLIDDGQADVDETDALFMISACAAFISYLIGKSRRASS